MSHDPHQPAYFIDPDGHLIFTGDSERATITRGFWAKGMRHVEECRQTAAALNEAGFPSPAFVWAVRSVEIFFRQCVALCTYYDEGNDVEVAIRKAKKEVGSGNWSKVWALVDRFASPDDPPLTDTDEDAWEYWKRHAVGTRDKVAHGLMDVSTDRAAWVIGYSERVVSWVTQRLSIADRGPLRGLLYDIICAMAEEEASDE